MQIIHQDLFGNLLAVSVHFEIGAKENTFLEQIGLGLNDPSFAIRLRNSEPIRMKSNKKLDLGTVIIYKISI